MQCANQMAPPGGDIDKIPPTIIESYPGNGTTNYIESYVQFTFSEYVNKRNINEAFFISPLLEGTPEFYWTNKTATIEFSERLKENTTYSVVIGTEIKDVNNNNNMLEPYTLTFSTGSKIDSGKISGKVYGNKIDGTLIFAYKVDTVEINIYEQKPDYLSQVNENGFYKFNGLGFGEYKVFAVKDEFKDLIYNVGDDHIGLPTENVLLSLGNSEFNDLDFIIHKEDTLAPNIVAVTMTDINHITIELSEPVDSVDLSPSNFSIVDSTTLVSSPIKLLYNRKPNEYVLVLTDSLNIDNENYLIVINIEDKKGNKLLSQSINFTVNEQPDTNNVDLKKIVTPFENNKIDYLSPSFKLYFTDAFYLTDSINAIKFYDKDSIFIPINAKKLDDSKLEVLVNSKLKEKEEYSITLNMSDFVDASNNKKDTTIVKKISTISELDFSGASGKVLTKHSNVRVLLKDIKTNDRVYTTSLEGNNNFSIERVLPGEYLLWVYSDVDSNEQYSHGTINPFKFAEEFKYYPDTLNLRARWPVGDIEIKF